MKSFTVIFITEKYVIGFLATTILLLFLFGCSKELDDSIDSIDSIDCNADNTILIDASRDGGVWWYPQTVGGFRPENEHQGKALADYLRNLGFCVRELPRGWKVSSSILRPYNKVIRAGKSGHYSDYELQAYDELLEKGASLILISEFLRFGAKDELAEHLGLPFEGSYGGFIEQFADHQITKNVPPLFYNAGSVILDIESNPSIEVLGWLSDVEQSNGIAAMGILNHPTSKIFFIGDINGLELMPQPLVRNLVKWAFD